MSIKTRPSIYEYLDYKEYIINLASTYPKGGRGLFGKMAKALGVSSVLVSQIFKGAKDLQLDHAILLCKFFELNELETEYFVALLSKQRAGNKTLRDFYNQQIFQLQTRALNLKNHLPKKNEVSEESKTEFYSSWIYSAIRQSCALEEVKTIEDLQELYSLPPHILQEKVNFLIKNNLLVKNKEGLNLGIGSTYLSKESSLVHSHRKNWRLKAIDSFSNNNPEDLFFVAPMVISEDLAVKLRAKFVEMIKELYEEAPKAAPEVTCCLNIDFFRF
ncbi:MAG: TIGR02147 family protein [Bacteriovoracaceae bacterium]|nr:TIGR02147 family protein [Bacteriovoracaceae bacterium]